VTGITEQAQKLAGNLRKRADASHTKYGTYLQPFNGRSAKVDLWQELADALMYEYQACIEKVTLASPDTFPAPVLIMGAPAPDYATKPEPPPMINKLTPVADVAVGEISREAFLIEVGDLPHWWSGRLRSIFELLLNVQEEIEQELEGAAQRHYHH